MSIQVVDEELGLALDGDGKPIHLAGITGSTKDHSSLEVNQAENIKENVTTSSSGSEHVEISQELDTIRPNGFSPPDPGGPSQSKAGAKLNQTHTNHLGLQRKFKPIPTCSWECARTRQQKEFIGYTQLEKLFDVPIWWPSWATLNLDPRFEAYAGISFGGERRAMCRDVPIITDEPQSPPVKAHVVLGIFNENGSLLEEVVIYIGGRARSKHLVHGRRGLFGMPILRDIRRFGLYKCDQAGRSHVRVELSSEDEDALAALFKCVQTWERYYTLKDISQTQIGIIPKSIYQFAIELLFYYLHKYNWVKAPDIEEEEVWCEWIQKNISGGNEDPAKGEYSIECVLSWSRPRVIRFVIVPFMLAAVGTTIFGLVWSFNIGSHKGDAAGGFTIASYFAALAGAVVALIGFFGGLSYK